MEKIEEDCTDCDGAGGDCEKCDGTGKLLHDDVNESYSFDKFMDSIVLKEARVSPRKKVVDSPQRERARRHQEIKPQEHYLLWETSRA